VYRSNDLINVGILKDFIYSKKREN